MKCNYNIVRKDRERDNRGGIAFVFEHNVKYKVKNIPTLPNPDNFLEEMSISIESEDTVIDIINVYIPSVNSIGIIYQPNITLLHCDNRFRND